MSYSSGDPYVPPGRATEEVLPLTESFGAPHRPEAQIPPAYWGTQYHTVSCYGTIVSSFGTQSMKFSHEVTIIGCPVARNSKMKCDAG